jgi:hypothetical protein
MRIALQEDMIVNLERKVEEMEGKLCRCQNRPETVSGFVGFEAEVGDELEYETDRSYLTPEVALEDVIAQDAIEFSTPPQGTRECCRTRVIEYLDDLVEIADDEASSSSSSEASDMPRLEEQENFWPVPVLPENRDAIPILPPPYAVSGQRAVRSKGLPKGPFHPYSSDRRPLGKIYERPGIGFRAPGHLASSRPTTPARSSSSSGGYGVVGGRSSRESERGGKSEESDVDCFGWSRSRGGRIASHMRERALRTVLERRNGWGYPKDHFEVYM